MQDLFQQLSTDFPTLFAIGKWLFGVLVLGAIAFCFNHYVKGIFFDKRCKPFFRFQNVKGKSLSLTKIPEEDIDLMIKERLHQEKEKLMLQFPKKNLDPYINPFLAVDEGMASASRRYNMEVEEYIPAKLSQIEKELRYDALSKCLEKISFLIENKGSLSTKDAKLKISVNSTGPKVYKCTALKELVGKNPKIPSYTHEYGKANILIFPTENEYKYSEFELSSSNIFGSIEIDVPDIVPGIPDKKSFAGLYVDKRTAGTVSICWTIHESTIKAKGINGEMVIVVE